MGPKHLVSTHVHLNLIACMLRWFSVIIYELTPMELYTKDVYITITDLINQLMYNYEKGIKKYFAKY